MPSTGAGVEDDRAAILHREDHAKDISPPLPLLPLPSPPPQSSPPPYTAKPLPYTPNGFPPSERAGTRVPKTRNSLRRHWKIWLAVGCILVSAVIIVPCAVILGAYKIQTQSYLNSIDLKSTEGNLSIEFNADSTIHLEYRNGPLVYPNNGSDFRKFELHDFETSLYMEDDAQDLKLLTTTNTWFRSSKPQTKYWFDIEPTESQQNDENLIQLLQKLLTDDEVKLRIKGAPKVKLDGMPREYNVKWDKTITMNGFGGISAFNSWRYDAFLYSDLLADWENDQDSPFHYYTIGDFTNAENTRGRLTIDISRIAVDVYADGNTHFGTGNITVLGGLPELPNWSGANVEIRLLDNTTRDDIEGMARTYGNETMAWYLRPTDVFFNYFATYYSETRSPHMSDAMRRMEDIQMKVRMD